MTTEKKSPVYFASLTVGNVKCFKEEQTIDLTDKQGNFAQWTVILGNNNTGKSTMLELLAGLEAVPLPNDIQELFNNNNNYNVYRPIITDRLLSNIIMIDWANNFVIKVKLFANGTLTNNIWGLERAKYYQTSSESVDSHNIMKEFKIYNYGVNRSYGVNSKLSSNKPIELFSGFLGSNELGNTEEWLLQTYLAEKNGVKSAGLYLEKVKKVLISGVLPDVKDLSFETSQQPPYNTYVLFDTDYGKLRLHELGYGYQSSISWLGDLMKRQFDRYPDSENPLAEPAIVLVDEIDMHLHPEWQRKIIQFLSHHFPKTQFIVTSHSPLVVQSAENVNVVLLNKEGDKTIISQPDIKTFKGWTVVEILEELMGLEGKTRSEYYLQLIQQFDEALDQENAEQAVQLHEKLSEILHPASTQRKLLRIQMAGLTPKPL